MVAVFPEYDTHQAATAAGCFHCGAQLDGCVVDTQYPPGYGKYRQRCTGSCGLHTFYDLPHDKGATKLTVSAADTV